MGKLVSAISSLVGQRVNENIVQKQILFYYKTYYTLYNNDHERLTTNLLSLSCVNTLHGIIEV